MNSQRLFFVVEDHPAVAEANCLFLQKLEPSSHCVICTTPAQALERLQLEKPDLIVVDLSFGEISGEKSVEPGLELLKEIFECYGTLNILIYSSDPLALIKLAPQINGHQGGFVVVDKVEKRTAFTSGAKNALDGELRIPRKLRGEMSLSENELVVLELLCKEFLSDQAIAKRMGVSKKTAQNYVQRLKEKLGVYELDDKCTNPRVAVCMKAVQCRLLT